LKNDTKITNSKTPESSFDYWQQTSAYSLKQYKLALKWATKESNLDWVKKYNQMWSKTYKIYGDEIMNQYTRVWQNIWEDFSILSFHEIKDYWKKMMIEYSEGTSKTHYETREKLAEDWIKTWLSS